MGVRNLRPSMHLSLPERSWQKSLKEKGLSEEEGGEGRRGESGVGMVKQPGGLCSDACGRLCRRLLFTTPQTSSLLLVANAHLLGDVHQRAGHRQTCKHTVTSQQIGEGDVQMSTTYSAMQKHLRPSNFYTYCHEHCCLM